MGSSLNNTNVQLEFQTATWIREMLRNQWEYINSIYDINMTEEEIDKCVDADLNFNDIEKKQSAITAMTSKNRKLAVCLPVLSLDTYGKGFAV